METILHAPQMLNKYCESLPHCIPPSYFKGRYALKYEKEFERAQKYFDEALEQDLAAEVCETAFLVDESEFGRLLSKIRDGMGVRIGSASSEGAEACRQIGYWLHIADLYLGDGGANKSIGLEYLWKAVELAAQKVTK